MPPTSTALSALAAKTTSASSTVLHWFRTDLRIHDNTALLLASKAAQSLTRGESRTNLACLFVVSPVEWRGHGCAPVKVDFWVRNVEALRDTLAERGIPLVVKMNDDKKGWKAVSEVVKEVCKELSVEELFYNVEYEVNEQRRDKMVTEAVAKLGVKVTPCHDQCVVEPGKVVTKEGKVYTVYTPFKNSWHRYVSENKAVLAVRDPPSSNNHKFSSTASSYIDSHSTIPSAPSLPAYSATPLFSQPSLTHLTFLRTLYPAGETAAQTRLSAFTASRIDAYHESRDLPTAPGTSSLSPYLALGVLSARQCVSAASAANGGRRDTGKQGAVVWIQELIWREFYRHVLAGFPHVCKNRAFKPQYEGVQWTESWSRDVVLPAFPVPSTTSTPPPPLPPAPPGTPNPLFTAWTQGRTGYPLVDAAMRYLLHTGWMHNRLRMIVSSFLVKDLLVDWRLGEAWFCANLIDHDLASNNGGWQWAAGTGTDAQPYFRIFNPSNQAEKFDKDGKFVRMWVKELEWVKDGVLLRGPWEAAAKGSVVVTKKKMEECGYPKPLVDHAQARLAAIAAFKLAVQGADGGGGDSDSGEEVVPKSKKRAAGASAGITGFLITKPKKQKK
ncbi:hypothetical protein M427DRAFT_126367 [Gonapodya prolifera JEL478]|uniref:Photolyase/cryptochrome alpha/beta domain-containing protein n=1 Tax=Gonapodya prolifera (strain JEL478) TaxID=1344416 RepID=A0A139A528_GONPJ|nr:hypothetical protein M427DRAFT_126367 [Gonapodya prolifera JEL478]|eukprot:KXS11844.1 hypothetical protein M427DRAFT_126367 [Gonapodya prolifera JEL478]